ASSRRVIAASYYDPIARETPVRPKRRMIRPRTRFLITRRLLVQALIDAVAWAIAITLAALLRVDFDLGQLVAVGQIAIVPLAGLCQAFAGLIFGLYTSRYRFGSFDEVAALVRAVAAATVALFVIDAVLTDPHLVPLTAVLAGGIIALVLMGGARYLWRLSIERHRRPTGEGVARAIVFGAGEGGAQMVAAMLRDPTSPLFPVAL